MTLSFILRNLKLAVLVSLIFQTSMLFSEVLVYKWRQLGNEFYSENAGTNYIRNVKKESGYLVIDINPNTGVYSNAKLVKIWREGKEKYVSAVDFGNGTALFEKQTLSDGKNVLLISFFNDDGQGEFYSGKISTLSSGKLGSTVNLEVAKHLRGHAAWDYNIQDRLLFTGSSNVRMSLDIRKTRNANLSGQTVTQVVNSLKSEYTVKNYQNPSPVAVDDTVEMEMDDTVNISVLSNDYDPQNATLTVSAITLNPLYGTATVHDNKTITYTPNTNWFGVDYFTYQVSNEFGSTDTAIVTVTVKYNKITSRVSVNSVEMEEKESDGASYKSCISRDGRYVVFTSDATNIIEGTATASYSDPSIPYNNIYLYDRGKIASKNVALLVNESAMYTPGTSVYQKASAPSYIASNGKIMDDAANYIVFSSDGNNLLLSNTESQSINDTNTARDVFIRYIERISKNPAIELYPMALVGTDAQNDNSFSIRNDTNGAIQYYMEIRDWNPATATGWCLFTGNGATQATVVVPRDSTYDVGLTYDTSSLAIGTYYCTVYVDNGDIHRIQLNIYDVKVRRASISSTGEEGNGNSYGGVISGDAGHVVFYSEANNLVTNDTNGKKDIFVYTASRKTFRISVASDGTEANDDSIHPSISADGRFVVFVSKATNLDGALTSNTDKWQIYLHDRDVSNSGTFDTAGNISTTLISVSNTGEPANGDCDYPYISGDATNGYYVVYQSAASNLDSDITDTNGVIDIFLYDVTAGTTKRVSIGDDDTTQGNGDSLYPAITEDGLYVVFQSAASNLVTGDTNGCIDIFMRNLTANTTRLISRSNDGEIGNGDSTYPSIGTDGNYLYTSYTSAAANLVSDDTNGVTDIFVDKRNDENN